MCTHLAQEETVRTRDPAMRNIANDGDSQTGQTLLAIQDGEGIQQRLSWMFVGSVPSIHNGRIADAGQLVRRTRRRMPDDDDIRSHGLQVLRRINQSFTLDDAAG